jgi:hypothetical protein
MSIKNLLACLEFQNEISELKKLGLTEEEIVGFFEFNWDIHKSIFDYLIGTNTDAQN